MNGELLVVKAFSVHEVYLDCLAGVGDGGFVAGSLADSFSLAILFLELGRATSLA